MIEGTRLAAARLLAGDAHPFLAVALWALTPVAQPGLGTMAVDERWRLYLDPEVLERWSVRECAGVLLHEVAHVVRDHAGRARLMGVEESTRGVWNWAADAEINDDLRHDAVELPDDPVLPERLRLPRGKVAEFYFSELLRRHAALPDAPECGAGCHGLHDETRMSGAEESLVPGLDAAEAMLLRKRIAEAVLVRYGNAPGKDPGGWERWAEALLHPRVDWRVLLRSQVRSALGAVRGSVDYTYRKPARRRVPGVVLPALQQPLPAVAVVIDTSASMRPSQLDAAWTEVHGAVRSLGVRRELLRVYAGDVAMTRVDAFGARRVALTGGGGTDMGTGIAVAMQGRPRPDVIIVMTDGYTPWPTVPPSARVIVALLHTDRNVDVPEWATCVRVDLDDSATRPAT